MPEPYVKPLHVERAHGRHWLVYDADGNSVAGCARREHAAELVADVNEGEKMRGALEKAERAILIHTFRPTFENKDVCGECFKNFRDSRHLREGESAYTVRRDALEAIESILHGPLLKEENNA